MKKLLFIITIISMTSFISCKVTQESQRNDTSTVNNQKSKLKDGTSFENAIVVSNVSEEYKFAQKACSECTFVRQALVFIKRKPYDILTFVKPSGEEIEYYFDISKFYGKF